MQDYIAIAIVVIAAAFLMRRGWLTLARRRGGGCGSCGNCPSNSAGNSANLVSISPIISHAKAQRREDAAN
jgi:hypothetical protein